MTQYELTEIIIKCEKELDLIHGKLGQEYYRNDLVLSVIDAVFSIGIRYSNVVKIVNRYDINHCLEKINNEHFVSNFIKNVESYSSIKEFAVNNLSLHRTSTRNGILKAEACYEIMKILSLRNINTIADFRDFTKNNSDNNKISLDCDIKSVRGQGSGVMLNYLYMLTGDDDKSKPDRMVIRFLESAINRVVNIEEAADTIVHIANQLKNKYHHLTTRLLDYLIWSYQRIQGK